MVYKFFVGSEDAEKFKLEIVIDSEDTFLRLRNTILDAAGYSRDELDSFYICDDDWEKDTEVTYIDMDSDSDEDVWLMGDTPLDELVEDEGQKLKFVFDYENERYFFMVLKETIPGKHMYDPLCQRKEGKAPAEKLRQVVSKPAPKQQTAVDEFDSSEFYGDESYNEDELSNLEGLDGEDEI